jgi:sortase A
MTLVRLVAVLALLVLGATPALAQGRRVSAGSLLWRSAQQEVGVSGRTLAFGPGHAGGSARPGAPGTAIVSGHRDTHFRFLQRVTPGEEVVVETPGRPPVRFHVREATVVDARTAVIGSAGDGTAALVLVTCYPFDAVNPGGPLRYVVAAEAASAEARRIGSE